MSLNIITNKNKEEISDYISSLINKKLEEGKNVLWLVSGGSSVPIEVLISRKIKVDLANKLTVTLIDERFGSINHSESNWLKLKDSGFEIKGAKMIPFLIGKDIGDTNDNIKEVLLHEFKKAKYKIGIFGVGIDGHTAGILPRTEAVKSKEMVCTYETDLYDRITITPKTIEMLDEAVLYAFGENKWLIIEMLKKDISTDECPVQILKKVPLLTIFTDYKKI